MDSQTYGIGDKQTEEMNSQARIVTLNANAAGSAPASPLSLPPSPHTPSINTPTAQKNNFKYDDGSVSVHGLYEIDVSIPRASLITHDSDVVNTHAQDEPVSPAGIPLPSTPLTPSSNRSHSPTTPPIIAKEIENSKTLQIPSRFPRSFQDLPLNRIQTDLESAGTSMSTLMHSEVDADDEIITVPFGAMPMPMPDEESAGQTVIVRMMKEKDGNGDNKEKMGNEIEVDIEAQNQVQSDKSKTKQEHDLPSSNSSNSSSSPTLAPTKSSSSSPNRSFDPQYEVSLEPSEDPKNLSKFRKWVVVLLICTAAFCVTCASSAAGPAEPAEASAFHVSRETTILGISLFVLGLGIGPLFQGPLSEFYGRNRVYWISFGLFWAGGWGVTFANDIGVFLAFRFITGFSGSAFFSVVGGTLSDLFTNEEVSTPLSVYTLSPFIGPILGPVISGFINQNTDWRWTYRFLQIWGFIELIAIIVLIPETYAPIILKRKATALRRSTGNNMWWAALERTEALENRSVAGAIVKSGWRPIQLMISERMALLLDLWNALIIGVLYLTFQAFPVIFGKGHNFNTQETGLTFLGIGLGMLIAMACQPFWNMYYKKMYIKYEGDPPPEIRLVPGMPGGILVFISLMWLAFTTYPSVPFIVPIIASIPFGTGIIFVFTSTFSYLVTAYRPLAASALSGNAALRSSFAAGFPLFAPAMYDRLGTVGATALLGGLTGLMAPLPFIFYRYGARIRAKSRLAVA